MNTKVENQTEDTALNDEALEDVAGGRGQQAVFNAPTKTVIVNGPNLHGYATGNRRGITKVDLSYDYTSGGKKT